MSNLPTDRDFLRAWLGRLLLCGAALLVLQLVSAVVRTWLYIPVYEVAFAIDVLHSIALASVAAVAAVLVLRFRDRMPTAAGWGAAIGIVSLPFFPDGMLGLFTFSVVVQNLGDSHYALSAYAILWTIGILIGVWGFAIAAERVRAHAMVDESSHKGHNLFGLPITWSVVILIWLLAYLAYSAALYGARQDPVMADVADVAALATAFMDILDETHRIETLGRAVSFASMFMLIPGTWTLLLIRTFRRRLL